ncbi:hypothetical protein RhiJN_18778 [Ceratobasidium sp. AG-Ba]|nr:hypothetical protein RhiJN_18778 [Ceratobasidium sp. AG-Ba]
MSIRQDRPSPQRDPPASTFARGLGGSLSIQRLPQRSLLANGTVSRYPSARTVLDDALLHAWGLCAPHHGATALSAIRAAGDPRPSVAPDLSISKPSSTGDPSQSRITVLRFDWHLHSA